jgi:hypothetical protein
VIPRLLIYNCRRFGTRYLFHLPRQKVRSDQVIKWSDAGESPKRRHTISIIIFIRYFHLHGSAATKYTHLYVSPKLHFSLFIYLVLSSCCVTFFLICCPHNDFGISVDHFPLISCSRPSLGFDLQSLLHQLINILSKGFIFKFSLLILLPYFLKI